MAARSYRVSRAIEAPSAVVWALLIDTAGYARWNRAVLRIDGSIERGSTIRLVSVAAPKRTFALRVAELTEPTRMVWASGMPLGLFRGRRTFTIEPPPESSRAAPEPGEVPSLSEFMKRSARSDFEHVQLIETCEKHGRLREALTLAEAAHKRDPKSVLFERAVLRSWERDGFDEEAFALRKRIYWRQPSLDHYRALLRAARAAGGSLDSLRAEVEAMLVERERAASKTARRGAFSRIGSPLPDVTLRVQWLLEEGRTADALALVNGCDGGTCHPQTLLDVAERLAAPQGNAQAFALIDRVARHEIARTTGRYDQAIGVVRLACTRLDDSAAGPYLARLKAEFKAKRNFVKGIEGLRPQLAP